jgi:uroporphyrinogen decarboxylase
LAAEAAVTAARRLGTDAAILFSDILLILEPMGLDLEYAAGEGPTIGRVVRSGADVDRLQRVVPQESLAFVLDAVRLTRNELPANVPLIGFSGAPFTLASYAIEGGGSRNYAATKTLMYSGQRRVGRVDVGDHRRGSALSGGADRRRLPGGAALR